MEMSASAWADLAERLPRRIPTGIPLRLRHPGLPTIAIGGADSSLWEEATVPTSTISLGCRPDDRPLLVPLIATFSELVMESESLSSELATTYGKLALLDELGRILPRCPDATAVGAGLAEQLADMIPAEGSLLGRDGAGVWSVLAYWHTERTISLADHGELDYMASREWPLVIDAGPMPAALGLGAIRGPSCAVPLRGPEGIEGLLVLGRPEGQPFASDEAKMAEQAAAQCAGYLFKLRQDAALRSAALLEHDVGIAGRVQQKLLPQRLPQPPGYRLAGDLHSARLVGGDYYDAILSDGCLHLVIADVSGHSVPAALAMSMLRAALRTALPQLPAPSELLAALNDQLCPDLLASGLFVSLAVARINLASGGLTIANAGHPPLLRRRCDGSIEHLDAEGPILGLIEHCEFQALERTLAPGEALVFHTDGISELQNSHARTFGLSGLEEALAAAGSEAEAIRASIRASLDRWATEGDDDTTLLVLSRDCCAV